MRTRKKAPNGKPPVKEFTKDNPCTKLELWNCFRGRRGFIRVQIDIAYSQIGKNAPRYMVSRGYAEQYEQRSVEYIRLTATGEEWLKKKFKRLYAKHPEWKGQVRNFAED